jgi:hypothetical protein
MNARLHEWMEVEVGKHNFFMKTVCAVIPYSQIAGLCLINKFMHTFLF